MDFIHSLRLPEQLAEVDPIVASFCGGAVGVVSALLVIEVGCIAANCTDTPTKHRPEQGPIVAMTLKATCYQQQAPVHEVSAIVSRSYPPRFAVHA